MARRKNKTVARPHFSIERIGDDPSCCSCEVDRDGKFVVRTFPASHRPDVLAQFGSPGLAQQVADLFFTGFHLGVARLVGEQLNARLPPSLSYLREFTKALHTYCVLCERVRGTWPHDPPPRLLDVWLRIARETPGLERLVRTTLERLWSHTERSNRNAWKKSGLSLRELLMKWSPQWGRVGQLVLRLDDVVENETHPFTLSASYYDTITSVQFEMPTPITAVVFGEPPVDGLRNYILNLLKEASRRNEVIRRLVASQSIFNPCPLIPRDAHAFVRDARELEALGIEVKLPRWWAELAQPEVHVRARVGCCAPAPIGVKRLLDIETAYVVGEHELTEGEWRSLVFGDHHGLTRVNGAWVDLTRARIQAACAAAKALDEYKGRGGLTYAEALDVTGCELANEGQVQPPQEVTLAANSRPAVVFEPGRWLAAAQTAIVQRDFRRGCEPGVRLRGELFAYQRQGVAWLSTLTEAGVGACLADDMGLGKTIQAIALIVALLRRGSLGPHLVVVPASLLTNWEQEFARFAPTIRIVTEHASRAGDDADEVPYVTLTSYGTLLRRSALRERPWSLVVLDEAQEIKNPRAKVTQAACSLRAQMKVCLTGTPVENDLTELWSLMDFLNPGSLGSEAEFRRWCDEHLEEAAGMGLLRKRVRHYILRRLKTDPLVALDLPTKVEVTVYCGLTPLQSDLYGQVFADMRRTIPTLRTRDRQGQALKVIGELKQICDHPATKLGDAYDAQSSGKFLRLRQLARSILDGGDRMLIFTQYKRLTRPIAALLAEELGREGLIIDGDTPERLRQEYVDAFQRDDGPPFMVLTYKTGGKGYTLTAASHVLLFDRWWNHAREVQAVDRTHRIGQTKSVVVHKFVCRGTLEERIVTLIERKRHLVEQLFADDDDGDEGIAKLSPEELLSLCALDSAEAALET